MSTELGNRTNNCDVNQTIPAQSEQTIQQNKGSKKGSCCKCCCMFILCLIIIGIGASAYWYFNYSLSNDNSNDNNNDNEMDMQFNLISLEYDGTQAVAKRGSINLQIITDEVITSNTRVYVNDTLTKQYINFPDIITITTQGYVNGIYIIAVIINGTDTYNETELNINVLVNDPGIFIYDLLYETVLYPGLISNVYINFNGTHYDNICNVILSNDDIIKNDLSISDGLIYFNIQLNDNVDDSIFNKYYNIPLEIMTCDGLDYIYNDFNIKMQKYQSNPFYINHGVRIRGEYPNKTTNNIDYDIDFDINDIDLTITSDEFVNLTFNFTNINENNFEIIIGFDHYNDYFILPVNINNTDNERRRLQYNYDTYTTTMFVKNTLTFFLRQTDTNTEPSKIPKFKDLIKNGGDVGINAFIRVLSGKRSINKNKKLTYKETKIDYVLSFTLKWTKESDLDLFVTAPNNNQIGYGSKTDSALDGSLDIDSNSGCVIDGIRIEKIQYNAPISGTYTVETNVFNECGTNSPQPFTLNIKGCDINGNYSIEITGNGNQIYSIPIHCNEYSIKGLVTGKTNKNNSFIPVGSIIRLLNVITNEGIAESEIKHDGSYTIHYPLSDTSAQLQIYIYSKNHFINVEPSKGSTYVYKHENIITHITNNHIELDIIINVNDYSGAFYIMAKMTEMQFLYEYYGNDIKKAPFLVVWDKDKYAIHKNEPVSYYSKKSNAIAIGDHPTDPDTFDDSVLLHEFGHLILFSTGVKLSGDGKHYISKRIKPSFALSEGYATYLAQKIIGSLEVCDYGNGGCTNLTKEIINNKIPIGTSTSDSSGDICESIVAVAAYEIDTDAGLSLFLSQAWKSSLGLKNDNSISKFGDKNNADFVDLVKFVYCKPAAIWSRNDIKKILKKYDIDSWISEKDFCWPYTV